MSVSIVDFSIFHHGCPASQSTEQFPDVSMKIISSNTYGKDRASVLQYARAFRKEDLRQFLEYWRNHIAVVKFKALGYSNDAAVFRVILRSPLGWVTKAVHDNGAFFSTAVPVSEGIERWHVLVEDRKKTSLFSDLDAIGVVKIDEVRQMELESDVLLNPSDPTSTLSARQLWVLRTALEKGYFESPRKIDSRELAREIGIAQSTLLEHLRKAQLKILQNSVNQA